MLKSFPLASLLHIVICETLKEIGGGPALAWECDLLTNQTGELYHKQVFIDSDVIICKS